MERLTSNSDIINYMNRVKSGKVNPDEIIAKVFEKLKYYEVLEKQGKLLKLPVAVGDTVYEVSDGGVRRYKVICIYLDEENVPKLDFGWHCTILDNFGKTVFLTRSDAERALAEMEWKNGD